MKKTILTAFIIIGTMALASAQTLIKDLHPGNTGSMSNGDLNRYVEFNGSKYFIARITTGNDGHGQYGLHKLEGTSIEFVINVDHGGFSQHAVVGNTLYYTSSPINNPNSYLYSFDGSTTTRHYVDHVDSLATIYQLSELDNLLYFTSSEISGVNAVGLFSYDGSTATKIATGLNNYINFDGSLYFKQTQSAKATPPYNKIDVWEYDGTNLTNVTNIGTSTTKVEKMLAHSSNYIFFVVSDAGNAELWKFDGTDATKVGDLANIYPDGPISVGNDVYFTEYKDGGHRIFVTDGTSIDSLTPQSTLGFSVGQYASAPKFAYSPTYEKIYFTKSVVTNDVTNVYSIDVNTKQMDTIFKGEKIYLPLYVAENGQVAFGQRSSNGHLLWTIQDDQSFLLCDTVGKSWSRDFWNMTSEGDTLIFTTSIAGDDYTGDEPHKISLTPKTTNSVFSLSKTKSLKVYPNPTSGFITIDIDEPINQIQVLNLAGQVLKTFTQTDTQINVADLTPGVYILQLEGQDGIGYSRFIKN